MEFHIESLDDLPEPIRSFVASQMQAVDHAHMEMDVRQRRLKTFFEDMGIEDLIVLSDLLNAISHSENPSAAASYYVGQLIGLLEFKHNVCSTHGVNHDDEDLKSFSSPEDNVNNGDTTPGDKTVPPGDQHYETSPEPLEAEDEVDFELLTKFRVARYEGDKVKCVDCGYAYPSLTDRMIKSPEDCPGCNFKSAHG